MQFPFPAVLQQEDEAVPVGASIRLFFNLGERDRDKANRFERNLKEAKHLRQ
jgi:hypothetical protein